jgi:hypothetical protein
MGIRATCKVGELSMGSEFPVEPGLRSLPVLGEFFGFLNNRWFWILGFHFRKEPVGSGYFFFCNFKN